MTLTESESTQYTNTNTAACSAEFREVLNHEIHEPHEKPNADFSGIPFVCFVYFVVAPQ